MILRLIWVKSVIIGLDSEIWRWRRGWWPVFPLKNRTNRCYPNLVSCKTENSEFPNIPISLYYPFHQISSLNIFQSALFIALSPFWGLANHWPHLFSFTHFAFPIALPSRKILIPFLLFCSCWKLFVSESKKYSHIKSNRNPPFSLRILGSCWYETLGLLCFCVLFLGLDWFMVFAVDWSWWCYECDCFELLLVVVVLFLWSFVCDSSRNLLSFEFS